MLTSTLRRPQTHLLIPERCLGTLLLVATMTPTLEASPTVTAARVETLVLTTTAMGPEPHKVVEMMAAASTVASKGELLLQPS